MLKRKSLLDRNEQKKWSLRRESIVQPKDLDKNGQLDFEFCLILDNNKLKMPDLVEQQKEVIRRCFDAGLLVTAMQTTATSKNFLCLLLTPTKERYATEKNRLVVERWLQLGTFGQIPVEMDTLFMESYLAKDNQLRKAWYNQTNSCTPADRIQTIARIISSPVADSESVQPGGAGISLDDDSNKSLPIVKACFPLHNRAVIKRIMDKWNYWIKQAQSVEIVNELRFFFGERVAFYYAFLFMYTKALVYPATAGFCIYFIFRWWSAIYYMRALSVLGFLVAFWWGGGLLKGWQRENERWNDRWNLRLFKEVEYPNPKFFAQKHCDVVDEHGNILLVESEHYPICRAFVYVQTFLFIAVFSCIYVVGITFFVQWYTAAMLAPLCSECLDCTKFLSCFNTRRPYLLSMRWVYIVVQGMLLGILLDVFVYLLTERLLAYFVGRENYKTEDQVQRVTINRMFAMNWISFFLWYLLIAFVVVPFGEDIEGWIKGNIHDEKFTSDWKNGRIDMSTALVTPLLITQALNLLVDVAIPHYRYKKKITHRKMAQYTNLTAKVTLMQISEYHAAPFDAVMKPHLDMGQCLQYQMAVPEQIHEISHSLGHSIPILDAFYNNGLMVADDIVHESQRPVYNDFPEYLKLAIQFGYVVMFTVVWPFCPVAALVNNSIRVRTCFAKLFQHCRRPVPRKATSIGQWEKMMFITLLISVFVVIGLICISSGQLENFVKNCYTQASYYNSDITMTPDFGCLSSRSRFFPALVLEHVAILLVYYIMDNIASIPYSIRQNFERKKAVAKQYLRSKCQESIDII